MRIRSVINTATHSAVQSVMRLSVVTLTLGSLASFAHAQIPVNNRMNISSGSCAGCDFSNKTIPGMTLRNSDFSNSMFNRSNLSGGKFYGSDLSNAHFNKAFLARTVGEDVTLSGAKLRDATLTEARINRSKFIGTDLTRADMARGEFLRGDFTNADLTSAMASGVNFTRSDFTNARFDHAVLQDAILDGAIFSGVEFGNADLSGASLKDADLSEANLSMAIGLTQAQLDTGCGDEGTLLPYGLAVPYCSEVRSADHRRHHPPPRKTMKLRDQQMAKTLNRSIERIEKVMEMSVSDDVNFQRELQKTHSELTALRRQIAQRP